MAFKKPSATMIRALLVGLTRRLRTPDGYAYQADADRWPTIQALKERGMIVMETREIIGASGARFQCTGAWLTEEGVTYLREVLEAAMRFAPEDRPEPYRTWLAEDDNADKAAAFLLGDDVAEVHTVTTTS